MLLSNKFQQVMHSVHVYAENKKRLQEFLLNEWRSQKHTADCYRKDLLCYDLTSGECYFLLEIPLSQMYEYSFINQSPT